MFLNNVSVGIYGDAVQRPGYRSAKLRTLLGAAERVLGPSAVASPLRIVGDRRHRWPSCRRGGDGELAVSQEAPKATHPLTVGAPASDAPGSEDSIPRSIDMSVRALNESLAAPNYSLMWIRGRPRTR